MRRAFPSTYCVLLSRFQFKFKVKPSLVFDAYGALSGFLAGVFGIVVRYGVFFCSRGVPWFFGDKSAEFWYYNVRGVYY